MIVAFTNTAMALEAEETTPMAEFTSAGNMTNKTTISWMPVDNVKRTCEAESRRRGNGGFKGANMEACSFWDKTSAGDTCVIITSKKVNYWTVGHEFRHCFQGSYHR